MRLTEVLREETIKVPLEGEGKEAVLHELIDLACANHDREAREAVYRSVLEREELMSTGIGGGIALPHGTLPDGSTFEAALGIAPTPIDYDAIDGEPVRLVFLLLSDEAGNMTKMKALARISRLLHRAEFREALATSGSTSEAMQVIVDEEARHRI